MASDRKPVSSGLLNGSVLNELAILHHPSEPIIVGKLVADALPVLRDSCVREGIGCRCYRGSLRYGCRHPVQSVRMVGLTNIDHALIDFFLKLRECSLWDGISGEVSKSFRVVEAFSLPSEISGKHIVRGERS